LFELQLLPSVPVSIRGLNGVVGDILTMSAVLLSRLISGRKVEESLWVVRMRASGLGSKFQVLVVAW
jgi:hypothetical protein